MNTKLPWYVTRFETLRSAASLNESIAQGLITTGPNTAQFVCAKGLTAEDAKGEFLRLAEAAYRSRT